MQGSIGRTTLVEGELEREEKGKERRKERVGREKGREKGLGGRRGREGN